MKYKVTTRKPPGNTGTEGRTDTGTEGRTDTGTTAEEEN